MRVLCILLTVAVSMIAVDAATAQKKNYICTPDGIQKCVASCNSNGGQIRKCPAWCERQKQERCR